MKKQYFFLLIMAAFLVLTSGFVGGVYVGKERGVPFVRDVEQWSIGIYEGESIFSFPESQPRRNPVLTAEDVTDVLAYFVADPFLVEESSTWHLFFEVYNLETEQGDLAVATSQDTKHWRYEQVIIDEPFHLSYPYVFRWEDDYYLIPESFESDSIRLYRATNFPLEWTFEGTLIDDETLVDPSIAYYNDKWWIFAATIENDTLRLFFADQLKGLWKEHPLSPIVAGDKRAARPGGRILVWNGRIFRVAQDLDPVHQIRAFEITELTPTTYAEVPVSKEPILKAGGSGWRAKGMHQFDPVQIAENRWIAAVDGYGTYRVFGFQY